MKPQFVVDIPATSANLGPGFDCMGLAMDLYNQFRVTAESTFGISVEGVATADISRNRDNLFVKAAHILLAQVGSGVTPEDWDIEMTTNIPSASGLGSSASAIAAGMLLANEIAGYYEPHLKLSRHEVVELATAMEGHPDNVTPALLGGAWLSLYDKGRLDLFNLALPKNLAFTVATPKVKVSTDESRQTLSSIVSRADAVYSVAQGARLCLALERGDLNLLSGDFGDRLHEPYRTNAIPYYKEIVTTANHVGAKTLTLSGSGPTLLAWCDGQHAAVQVRDSIYQAWSERGVECSVDVYLPLRDEPTVEIVRVKEAKL